MAAAAPPLAAAAREAMGKVELATRAVAAPGGLHGRRAHRLVSGCSKHWLVSSQRDTSARRADCSLRRNVLCDLHKGLVLSHAGGSQNL